MECRGAAVGSAFTFKYHDPTKVVDILRKTWAKMSPAGHAAALELGLAADARTLLDEELAGG